MAARMTKGEVAVEIGRRRMAGLALTGNTYPAKDEIRAAGGMWDGVCWLMPDASGCKRMQDRLDQEANDKANPKRRAASGGGYDPSRPVSYCPECDSPIYFDMSECDGCGGG